MSKAAVGNRGFLVDVELISPGNPGMPYYEFVWAEFTLAKIEFNGLSQNEVESIICDPLKTDRSHSSGRPMAFGLADDGRMVACVYEYLDELRVFPVTAYYTQPKQ